MLFSVTNSYAAESAFSSLEGSSVKLVCYFSLRLRQLLRRRALEEGSCILCQNIPRIVFFSVANCYPLKLHDLDFHRPHGSWRYSPPSFNHFLSPKSQSSTFLQQAMWPGLSKQWPISGSDWCLATLQCGGKTLQPRQQREESLYWGYGFRGVVHDGTNVGEQEVENPRSGMGFWNLKAFTCDTPLPTRPHLLILPNSSSNCRSNIHTWTYGDHSHSNHQFSKEFFLSYVLSLPPVDNFTSCRK